MCTDLSTFGRKPPYQRGYDDAMAGRRGPSAFPKGNASWEEKLYHRGFVEGNLERVRVADAARAAA